MRKVFFIKNTDEIAVIGNKGIVEKGTDEELMKIKGVYSRLHEISA